MVIDERLRVEEIEELRNALEIEELVLEFEELRNVFEVKKAKNVRQVEHDGWIVGRFNGRKRVLAESSRRNPSPDSAVAGNFEGGALLTPDIASGGAFPPGVAAGGAPLTPDIELGGAFPLVGAADRPAETSGRVPPPLDIESGGAFPLGGAADEPGETSDRAPPPLDIESRGALPLHGAVNDGGEGGDSNGHGRNCNQGLAPKDFLGLLLAFVGALTGILSYLITWRAFIKQYPEGLFTLEDALPLGVILLSATVFIIIMRRFGAFR